MNSQYDVCYLYDGCGDIVKYMDGKCLTRSIWLIDGDKYVDLSKYGALDLNQAMYFIGRYIRDQTTNEWRRCDQRLMVLGRGDGMTALTREEIESWVEMDPTKHIEKHNAMLSSFKRAVERYSLAKKRSWGLIKSLVYMNKHYMDVMEESYSPDGSGYKRTHDHWVECSN